MSDGVGTLEVDRLEPHVVPRTQGEGDVEVGLAGRQQGAELVQPFPFVGVELLGALPAAVQVARNLAPRDPVGGHDQRTHGLVRRCRPGLSGR